jgi:transcriptional regulator with XRE-family HTH domain
MGEREAFGPNLRRIRVQRGISLERIAASTKVGIDLLAGLERNDLSRWPSGIYARSYVRAYAMEIGVDPDVTVDEFCRNFPQGDRRVARLVREQAALVGHDLRWKDDLAPEVERDRRAPAPDDGDDSLPVVAFTRMGRLVAALVDLAIVIGLAFLTTAFLPLRISASLAISAIVYHAGALVLLGCSPAVWTIETYLESRHPHSRRAPQRRFLRLLRNSDGRAKA